MKSGKKKISILEHRNLIIIGRAAIAARNGDFNQADEAYTELEITELSQRHWCDDGRYDGNLDLPNNYFMTKPADSVLQERLTARFRLLRNSLTETRSEFIHDFCEARFSDAQRMLWLQETATRQLVTAFSLATPVNHNQRYRLLDLIHQNVTGGRTRSVKTARILLEYAAYYGSTWACHMIIKGMEKGYFLKKDFNGYDINDFLLLQSRNFQFLIVYPEHEDHNPQSKLQKYFRPPSYAEHTNYWNKFTRENINKKGSALIEEFQILHNELTVLFAATSSVIEKVDVDELGNLKKYFSNNHQPITKSTCNNAIIYQLILERDKLLDCLTKLAPAMFQLSDAFHSGRLSQTNQSAADINVLGPGGFNHLTIQLDRVLRSAISDIQRYGATTISFTKDAFTDLLNGFMHKAVNSQTCGLDPSFSIGPSMTLLNAYKKAIDTHPSKSIFTMIRNKRNKERAPEIFWENIFATLLEPNSRDNVANHQLVESGLLLYIFFSLMPDNAEQPSAQQKFDTTNAITDKLSVFPQNSLEGKLCRHLNGQTPEKKQHVRHYPSSPGITMAQTPPHSCSQATSPPVYNNVLTGITNLSPTKK